VDGAHVQSSLLGWIIALAIMFSVLLRRDKDLRQRLFVLLSGNVAAYYFFTFLYAWRAEPWFERIALALAVTIPLSGLYFFRAFSAASRERLRLSWVAIGLGVLLIGIVLHPTLLRPIVGFAVLAYVVGFLLVAILDLNVQARSARTRVDAARIRYLFAGALATLSLQVIERSGQLFSVAMPPIGLAMTLLFLYVISQTIVRYRILDLYETLGRFAVLTLMGAALAGIYSALVLWAGSGFTINAFLASLVILILFDPLRDLVERRIADFFFGERRELEQRIAELRRRLMHIINIDVMVEVLLLGLEESRRFTHGALYLIDPHARGFDLRASFGPPPALGRVEAAAARRFLRPFIAGGAVSAAALRLRQEQQAIEDGDPAGGAGQPGEALELLTGLQADILLSIEGDEQLLGLLALRDERLRDPFTPEEVGLLTSLAGQVATMIENSGAYQRMKERDRLAALGQMSAGLAHEIRNPLGAIKAAAQVIEELDSASAPGRAGPEGEFLSVIVEEVDRLNRVVSDFLAYAKPSTGQPKEHDVGEILKRTLQVFETGREDRVDLVVELADGLAPVLVDGEHLHQVFLNLVINAVQAMEGREQARLEISTRSRRVRRVRSAASDGEAARFVEIRFADNGPGISPENMQSIFIPFFTTKTRGSGLGLAVCQRIVRDAGGEIEVRSQEGQGTIFTVVLPAAPGAPAPADHPSEPPASPGAAEAQLRG
jgi:signal transduction histidine kinase